MGEGEGGGNARGLDQTPTWAVASVCAVIIIISIALEKGLHHIGTWLTERKKKAMVEALEKVKAELMILGFISLLLTFGQNYIVKICIPEEAANTMLPCPLKQEGHAVEPEEGGGEVEAEEGSEVHYKRLLWGVMMDLHSKRRVLSEEETGPSCPPGKVPLISMSGLHQLHIFIFFLAVFHVIYSALTMALGRAKIRGWKEWEKETSSLDYESNDPKRFRFSHETSFVRQHTSFWNKIPVSFYLVSFFRQFFRSVRRADYLAMRHGFISVHLVPGSKFNFQQYIKRSLEDDFKVVVGISPVLWASAVIYLLLNVDGWEELMWISVMPLFIILAVGTKLQAIITSMALEIKERHAVVQGIPLVQVSDHHFWFGRPHLVLFLIHFTLFQNAFQLIYLFWIWYEYGLDSCFHESPRLLIERICLGVGVQFLCSYITLPLYALVSQMGTQMKKTIFDEQTSKAITKWHRGAKKKNAKLGNSPSASPRGSPTASDGQQLQLMKPNGRGALTTNPSKRRMAVDQEAETAEANLQTSAPAPAAAAMVSMNVQNDQLTGSTEYQSRSGEQHNDHDGDEFVLIKL